MNIVKPSTIGDIPYLAFKAAFKEQIAAARQEHLKAPLMEAFNKALNALNRSLQTRESVLFPAINLYLRQPSERTWKIVREAALDDLEQVKTSVRLAIEFDSQFYEVGTNILTIASGGTELVDQKYRNAFGKVRETRSIEQKPTLNEMLAFEARPTEAQVLEWQAKLKETYAKLKSELQRLITLVQQRT